VVVISEILYRQLARGDRIKSPEDLNRPGSPLHLLSPSAGFQLGKFVPCQEGAYRLGDLERTVFVYSVAAFRKNLQQKVTLTSLFYFGLLHCCEHFRGWRLTAITSAFSVTPLQQRFKPGVGKLRADAHFLRPSYT